MSKRRYGRKSFHLVEYCRSALRFRL